MAEYAYDYVVEDTEAAACWRANQYGRDGWRWVNPSVMNGRSAGSMVTMIFEKEVLPKSSWVGLVAEGSATR